MPTQKEYWDKKIRDWSYASYKKIGQTSLIEKIASFFRAVETRKEVTLKLIGPKAKNKTIVELGCGMGEFAMGLVMRYKPKKVIVYDISEIAIKSVKKDAKKLEILSKMEFYTADVTTIDKFPQFDLVVGLGFIEYLNPQQMEKLFAIIGDKPFLFSYFEKKLSFYNLLHKIYISMQKCPGAYKYSKKEIRAFIPQKLKLYFVKKNGLQFITNSIKIR